MQGADSALAARLLAQIRAEFDQLRWKSNRTEAFLVHRATNAEAEGVVGIPQPNSPMVAFGGAGHRDARQVFDDKGHPKFRDDPIVDVNGNPVVNSAGSAFDIVMPAFRTITFSGERSTFGTLSTIAKRAGKAIASTDSDILSLLRGWNFSTSEDLWWAFVFELAWSGKHPLLTASKRLWLPAEHPSTFVPYDKDALASLVSGFEGRFKVPEKWLKRLPDAWTSEIDDAVVASIDALDYVLEGLSPSDSSLKAVEQNSEGSSVAAATSAQDSAMQIRRRFRVALSFPGEHRTKISKVAQALKEVFREERVFYDKYHEVELSVPSLDLVLQRIYRDEADLVVVFVCGAYNDKEWCGLEWRAIRDLIKSHARYNEDVMFLRLDDGVVDGLLSLDGFIDVSKKSPQAIANMIMQRWSASR